MEPLSALPRAEAHRLVTLTGVTGALVVAGVLVAIYEPHPTCPALALAPANRPGVLIPQTEPLAAD